VVIAGKAHPQDGDAKHTLRAIFETRRAPRVGERIIFLEDYDLALAAYIVAGADVWVNLPRPPQEASGTSGMKAALNGALNLSVLDGWWLEAHDPAIGWSIATPDGDPAAQDDHDAAALLDCLERDVVPLFYDRGADGLPRAWIARMKGSLARLVPRFSAERTMREYVERLYTLP
jgi:starch phosphorylase